MKYDVLHDGAGWLLCKCKCYRMRAHPGCMERTDIDCARCSQHCIMPPPTILLLLQQFNSCDSPASRCHSELVASLCGLILQGYPTNIGEIETAMKVLQASFCRLQDAAHLLIKRLVTLKMPACGPGGGGPRESVLAWIVAVIEANQPRTNMGETGIKAQAASELTAGGSDAFTVNLAAVLLRFARPFVQGYLEK